VTAKRRRSIKATTMLHHRTYDKLILLKLFGMTGAFADQGALDLDHLGFERLGLLVDHEAPERDGKLLALRLQRAKLKPNTAVLMPASVVLQPNAIAR
jgi:hypothetical protein